MKITKLRNIVNNNFNNVIKYCTYAENLYNDKIFHNSYRMKVKKKGYKTYDGKLNCGITTFILGNILKNYIPVKLYLYKDLNNDHVFLKYKDIIIDPSYKQFFSDLRKKSLSNYNDYLYEKIPPFFVGNYDDLISLYNSLYIKNKEEFNSVYFNESVLNNWNEDYDVTYRLDYYYRIYNREYVKTNILKL